MERSLPAKPLPTSNPFVAGNDIKAFASSASSLSNTGDPKPYNKVIIPKVSTMVQTMKCGQYQNKEKQVNNTVRRYIPEERFGQHKLQLHLQSPLLHELCQWPQSFFQR